MTEQEKAKKYGMKWFVKTFGRKPTTDNRPVTQRETTYEASLVQVYNLLDKYNKIISENTNEPVCINVLTVIDDFKSIIQPLKPREWKEKQLKQRVKYTPIEQEKARQYQHMKGI